MKLMALDMLRIPDTEYDACVTMPSSQFGRIVRDLSLLGESVRIEVSEEGIRFVGDGEAADGNIHLKRSGEDEEGEEPGDEESADVSEGEGGNKTIKKEGAREESGEAVEMNGVDDEDEEAKGEFKLTKRKDEDEDSGGSSKNGGDFHGLRW